MRAKYLGLDLPSPIIVSSSPYTSNVKSVEQCAASGAGAVVLKSIFEEQILHHAAALDGFLRHIIGRQLGVAGAECLEVGRAGGARNEHD